MSRRHFFPPEQLERLHELARGPEYFNTDELTAKINAEFPDLPEASRTVVWQRIKDDGIKRPKRLAKWKNKPASWDLLRVARLHELNAVRIKGKRLAYVDVTAILNSEFPKLATLSLHAVRHRCWKERISKQINVRPGPKIRRGTIVPSWVPDCLVQEYRELVVEFDEFSAASTIRRLKRDMRQEAQAA